MAYRERLTAPVPWWVVGLVVEVTFVVAVAAVLPVEVAVANLVVTLVVVAGGAETVAAGARRPVACTGRVTVLTADTLRHRIGPGADARACPGYRARCDEAVEAEAADPDDAHPYLSARHAAVEAARTDPREEP